GVVEVTPPSTPALWTAPALHRWFAAACEPHPVDATGGPVRPMLDPALALVWRDEDTLQLGADPQRAVVLAGVDAARAGVIALLDGTRSRDQALGEARAGGLDADEVARLLDLLQRAGVLLDGAAPVAALAPDEARRFAPD